MSLYLQSLSDAEKAIPLKVMETHLMDVGAKRARIDKENMKTLGVNTGDIIRLKAKQVTYSRCFPLLPTMQVPKDHAETIVRLDGVTRYTLGVEIGDTILVSKSASILAKSAIVKPLEPIPPMSELYVTDALEGQALAAGDTVQIPYFDDKKHKFRVLEVRGIDNLTIKDGAGIVTQETKFAFADE